MSVCHSFVSLVQSLVNIHVYTQWYLSLYTFILYPSSFVNHHTYMIIQDTPPIAQQSIPPGPQLWTAERKTNELGDRDVACSSLHNWKIICTCDCLTFFARKTSIHACFTWFNDHSGKQLSDFKVTDWRTSAHIRIYVLCSKGPKKMEPSCFCSFDEDDDDDKDDEDDEDEDDDGEEDEDDEDVENYADRGGGDDDALSCLFGCVLGLLKNKHSNEKSLLYALPSWKGKVRVDGSCCCHTIRTQDIPRWRSRWTFILCLYNWNTIYTYIYILCIYIYTSILSDFPRFCWWLPPFLLVFLFPGVCRLPYLLFGEYPHYTFVIPRWSLFTDDRRHCRMDCGHPLGFLASSR